MKCRHISLDDKLQRLTPEARMVFLVNRGIDPGSAVEQVARQAKILSDIAKDRLRSGYSITASEGFQHQMGPIVDLLARGLLEDNADLFAGLARAMKKVRSEREVEAGTYLTRLVLFKEAELGPVNLSQIQKCLNSWRVKISLRHLRRLAERYNIQTVGPGRPRKNRTNSAHLR